MANPVERATITPRYVNPPREGKKSGQAKLGADKFDLSRDFLVRPDLVPLMQGGQTYDVEYESRDFQGATYRTITRVTPRQVVQTGNGAGLATTRSPQAWGGKTLQERRDIFVCGAFNNLCASGVYAQMDVSTATQVVNDLCEAFHLSRLSKPYPQQQPAQTAQAKLPIEEEMDDQIPF